MGHYERIASALIGTPLQRPAEAVRDLLNLPKRLRHPELRPIFEEHALAHRVLGKIMRDGMNGVDVGCHLGSFLNDMIRLSPSGKHVGVEAIPYKAEWLRRKFPQAEIHQVAASDHTGQVTFFIDPKRSGFSSMGRHSNSANQLRIEVPCRRLDDLIAPDRPIHFIKIDIEGAELLAFQGAERILKTDRPALIFECTKTGLTCMHFTAEAVYQKLNADLGYAIYLFRDWLCDGPALDLERFQGTMDYPFQAFNYLALPQAR
jgi:FkbM family methyltransferase